MKAKAARYLAILISGGFLALIGSTALITGGLELIMWAAANYQSAVEALLPPFKPLIWTIMGLATLNVGLAFMIGSVLAGFLDRDP